MDRTQSWTKMYIIYRASSPHLTREQDGRMFECLSTDTHKVSPHACTHLVRLWVPFYVVRTKERKRKTREERRERVVVSCLIQFDDIRRCILVRVMVQAGLRPSLKNCFAAVKSFQFASINSVMSTIAVIVSISHCINRQS